MLVRFLFVFDLLLNLLRIALWPSVGKELSPWLFSFAVFILIVSVPLPTSDHGVTGSNPTGGKILPEPKRCFIAKSLSCSPFHHLNMTEILLKGT